MSRPRRLPRRRPSPKSFACRTTTIWPNRHDDALIGSLAAQGIAYVPFFPLGGFTPLQSSVLSDVAGRLGVAPMQVALA